MSQTIDAARVLPSFSEAEVIAAGRRFFEEHAQPRAEVIRGWGQGDDDVVAKQSRAQERVDHDRSEEHTSELQSLMRISYAVFCLKKKTNKENTKEKTIMIRTR